MNEYQVGRASADLRDAILKCLGYSPAIRLPGPKPSRRKPRTVLPPPKQTYRVERCDRVETIKATVAEFYGVDPAAINGPRGPADISRARHVAMYLSREVAGRSFPRIGWMFGRDHTTVMHACREVERLRTEDAEYAYEIRTLLTELEPLRVAA